MRPRRQKRPNHHEFDLRIRDIPVRYRDRTYGETNISRFKHGWILLKMVWFGLRKLKWV